ncbi:MAG: hypothetical protein ACP6IS_05740 [Candidatus Asgardarchaeia archaeon]
MASPESLKIGVFGLPADIVGAFMTSYFGAKEIDRSLSLKYKIVYSLVNNIPLKVQFLNFGAFPFKSEKKREILSCNGFIIVLKSEHEHDVFSSEIYKEVKKKGFPHLIIHIDGDITLSDFEEFDLIKGLKWLVSASYEYKVTQRTIIPKQTLVVSHEEFVKRSTVFYGEIKKLDKSRELVEEISRQINAENWEFKIIPKTKDVETVLREKLDRMTFLKIQEYLDKMKELEQRYLNHEISAELYRAMASQQIRRIFNHLIKYL